MGETRKLAAILASDVVGHSRFTGLDEGCTLARLRGLRSDLIDPAIAASHGRIVKRPRGGFLASRNVAIRRGLAFGPLASGEIRRP